jgi:hypothetical protein
LGGDAERLELGQQRLRNEVSDGRSRDQQISAITAVVVPLACGGLDAPSNM